jgi:NADH-quinone oxidoreductase subunit I
MNGLKQLLKTIFFVDILKGMALTMRTMLHPAVTRQYPTFKRKPFAGSRGLHAMRRNEKGEGACIGCGLCEAVCPSEAIKVVTTEGPDHQKIVMSYELDLMRCVFCGFCIDACPVSAILQTPEFELACYSRRDVVYTKDRLIEVGDRFMGKKTENKNA